MRRRCCRGVDVLELPIDDSWMRDNGPVFVVSRDGRRAGVDFRFNGWGGKFEPYDRDDDLPRVLLERLGIDAVRPRRSCSREASIAVDGEGTLITTEQCLLHPNRNPELGRADIEQLLCDYLGVETVIWLGAGPVRRPRHRRPRRQHRPLRAAREPCCSRRWATRRAPTTRRCSENRDRLAGARDARGRAIEVVEIDVLPTCDVRGATGCVPYLNLYVVNGAVIVPVVGDDPDRDAEILGLIASLYAPREVVPMPGRTLAEGGGGIHCITQQVPAVAA